MLEEKPDLSDEKGQEMLDRVESSSTSLIKSNINTPFV